MSLQRVFSYTELTLSFTHQEVKKQIRTIKMISYVKGYRC